MLRTGMDQDTARHLCLLLVLLLHLACYWCPSMARLSWHGKKNGKKHDKKHGQTHGKRKQAWQEGWPEAWQ